MGKKYFCDYCEKHIQRDPSIVRKHNEGIPHCRARAEYYERFKDPSVILSEASGKKQCRTLMTGAECQFGPNCRFNHYTTAEMDRLGQQVDWTARQKAKRTEETLQKLTNAPNIVQQFLERREARLAKEQTEYKPFWSYSEELRDGDLPPSLREIDPGRIDSSGGFARWG
ncbi:zinc finger matrin-type protein 5 [Culex pipiens pallens]|uniref:zinc finger matrin-type protein 5 n=1 Tax=Culex pipiens pallens TaxID=42434 RepID=UPI001954ADCD|nr:zinc finger matrin-type protein 5 [Culex pipiens pallens]